MFTWNGLSVAIAKPMEEAAKAVKQKKTTYIVIIAALAAGIFLFLRGK